MIIIDNYDSFTYNIVEYFRILGKNVKVFKNDEITVEELKEMDFDSIVLSPGPSNPENAGITMEVISAFHKTKPILGVCLGFQAIAAYFGARVVESDNPIHGKCSEIFFAENEPLFKGLKQGFNATRYHSLVVKDWTHPIVPIAMTKDDILMGLKIDGLPIYGVQFHPEAILTEQGIDIFKNFMEICGIL